MVYAPDLKVKRGLTETVQACGAEKLFSCRVRHGPASPATHSLGSYRWSGTGLFRKLDDETLQQLPRVCSRLSLRPVRRNLQ